MNIFYTDDSPIVSACNLDDLRVNKMITESTQMISYAVWSHFCEDKERQDRIEGFYLARKVSFVMHPCSIWARRNKSNFSWLCVHALHMCMLFRTKSNKVHKCEPKIERAIQEFLPLMPDGDITPFANCTIFKTPFYEGLSTKDKYRRFMNHKWFVLDPQKNLKPTWFNREKPKWIDEKYKGVIMK